MGGKASKPSHLNGTTTTNGQQRPFRVNSSPYSRADSEDDDDDGLCTNAFPFSGIFCPPHPSTTTNNGGKKKRRGNNKYDPIGTPVPDTPEDARRNRRQRMIEEAEASLQGVEGSSLFLSTYAGLEKEIASSRDLSGSCGGSSGAGVGGGGRGGGGNRLIDMRKLEKEIEVEEMAEIHEGKNEDLELYKKYEICEVLGVGSTSTCHRCVNRKTKNSYACKIIDKVHIEQRFRGMIEQFHTEIEALRSLHHPNIIRLYDVYITDEKIYIVMELMEGGELFDYVVQKGTLNEEEASRIVRKVTSALVYMHSKNIIHRDLKPENLLLTHKPRSAHDLEVKIIDFGLSKCMDEPVARSFLGTRGYLAPEMLQRKDYTRAVDAWALGVIVFVLLCGCLPFDDDSHTVPSDDLVQKKFVLRFPRWAKNLSPSAKDLLSHLLDVNPLRRYSAEQALDHPWVTGQSAPRDNLLQSPGRIRKSPVPVAMVGSASGRRQSRKSPGGANVRQQPSHQQTREYVASIRGNRARVNSSSRPAGRQLVRKTSI